MKKKTLLSIILAVFLIFIVATCVRAEELIPQDNVYVTCKTNVYDYPDAYYSDYYEIYGCTQVLGTRYDDNWYVIENNGYTGYVEARFISYEDPAYAGRCITPSLNYSFMFNDGVSEEKFQVMEETFGQIPENIKLRFIQDGWKIIVSDRNLDALFRSGNSSILGLSIYSRKEIWISHRNKTGDTLVHEIGHFVDGQTRNASLSDYFLQIYGEEVNSFASYHQTNRANYNTSHEYFAECFSDYILKPDALFDYCPQTYSFISNYICMIWRKEKAWKSLLFTSENHEFSLQFPCFLELKC